MSQLMLHCGANAATYEDVLAVATPEPTETHFPIAHHVMIETTLAGLKHGGWVVDPEGMEFGLWSEAQRMFGVMALIGEDDQDYQLVVGIRNSHDRSFAAGICLGARVFVCDNLSFSSEVVRLRKHTRHIMRDLNRILTEAIGEIGSHRIRQEDRIAAYKQTECDDSLAHDLLVRAVDAQCMANSYIPKVLQEWREPRHDEFQARTIWSLQNAFTEAFKDSPQGTLDRRTMGLNGLLDLETDAFGVAHGTPDFEGELEIDYEIVDAPPEPILDGDRILANPVPVDPMQTMQTMRADIDRLRELIDKLH